MTQKIPGQLTTDTFGITFTPDHEAEWDRTKKPSEYVYGKFTGRYDIYLPHSCDEWNIASGKKEVALKELNTFIEELLQVKEALENHEN